jgi:hypothetical protein
MGTFLQWLKEDLVMVRKHPLFTLSLLIVGILIGYGSSIPEQRLGRISYGKIGYRDVSNAELKQKATQLKAPSA